MKYMVMALVLCLTVTAGAVVIDIVTLGTGSLGNAGTATDPLEQNETIPVGIVLAYNAYPGSSDYDGYMLNDMDISLSLAGDGQLSYTDGSVLYNSAFFVTNTGSLTASGASLLSGITINPVDIWDASGPSPDGAVLVSGMYLTCTGTEDVTLSLSIAADCDYAQYWDPVESQPLNGWETLENSDLGSLTIYQVPEPVTILIFGLGGLFLRHRNR